MRVKIILLLVVALLLPALPGMALDKEEMAVKETVEKLLPGATVDAVNRMALPGLFEVIIDENMIYYMPASGQFIAGALFSKDGDNLSKASFERLAIDRANKIKALSGQKDKAIKIGTGPIEVIEVSDPDCPYCRKMEAYWKMHQGNVTRYVFLMPIIALHPDSEKKARYILASSDQAKALQDVLSGKLDEDDAALRKTFDDKGRLNQLQTITGQAGVKSTPTYLINGTIVNGADTEQIDELIRPVTEKNTSI
jgi:thiol:disulfide interchange protein DsbC